MVRRRQRRVTRVSLSVLRTPRVHCMKACNGWRAWWRGTETVDIGGRMLLLTGGGDDLLSNFMSLQRMQKRTSRRWCWRVALGHGGGVHGAAGGRWTEEARRRHWCAAGGAERHGGGLGQRTSGWSLVRPRGLLCGRGRLIHHGELLVVVIVCAEARVDILVGISAGEGQGGATSSRKRPKTSTLREHGGEPTSLYSGVLELINRIEGLSRQGMSRREKRSLEWGEVEERQKRWMERREEQEGRKWAEKAGCCGLVVGGGLWAVVGGSGSGSGGGGVGDS